MSSTFHSVIKQPPLTKKKIKNFSIKKTTYRDTARASHAHFFCMFVFLIWTSFFYHEHKFVSRTKMPQSQEIEDKTVQQYKSQSYQTCQALSNLNWKKSKSKKHQTIQKSMYRDRARASHANYIIIGIIMIFFTSHFVNIWCVMPGFALRTLIFTITTS